MTEPVTNDKPVLSIALSLAAAALLVYAALSPNWLINTSTNDTRSFGLRTYSECSRWTGLGGDKPTCAEVVRSNTEEVEVIRALGLNAADQTSSAFAPVGLIAFVVCFVAAGGLVAGAALVLARKRPELPIAPTTIAILAIMVALVTGCVFVATKPGPTGFVGVGLGFWAFGIGNVLGIAGAQLTAKAIRPRDPDLLADAMNPDDFPA